MSLLCFPFLLPYQSESVKKVKKKCDYIQKYMYTLLSLWGSLGEKIWTTWDVKRKKFKKPNKNIKGIEINAILYSSIWIVKTLLLIVMEKYCMLGRISLKWRQLMSSSVKIVLCIVCLWINYVNKWMEIAKVGGQQMSFTTHKSANVWTYSFC
jgi:hypothetical protein